MHADTTSHPTSLQQALEPRLALEHLDLALPGVLSALLSPSSSPHVPWLPGYEQGSAFVGRVGNEQC
jgi:hypothetical protein